MNLSEITDRVLVQSLRSVTCPACGSVKKSAQTLCLADYRKLPVPMRKALYARVGSGYREAVIEAMIFLEVEEPVLRIGTADVKDGDA